MTKFLFYRIFKWNVSGNFKFLPKKCVIIVAPHTHWFDFFIGIMVRRIFNLKIYFIGKKELFFFPLNLFMRYMGGYPVNRNSNSNTVDQITEIYSTHTEFRLALSPEGTRKKVNKWKSGFYFIAKKAKVPIICVSLNYIDRIINFSEPFEISGDYNKDLNKFKCFFKGIKGKVIEYS